MAWSSAVTSWMTRRGTRPPAVAGGTIGGPTMACHLWGLMNLAPFGITRSEPPIPTGTIGTPARRAT